MPVRKSQAILAANALKRDGAACILNDWYAVEVDAKVEDATLVWTAPFACVITQIIANAKAGANFGGTPKASFGKNEGSENVLPETGIGWDPADGSFMNLPSAGLLGELAIGDTIEMTISEAATGDNLFIRPIFIGFAI